MLLLLLLLVHDVVVVWLELRKAVHLSCASRDWDFLTLCECLEVNSHNECTHAGHLLLRNLLGAECILRGMIVPLVPLCEESHCSDDCNAVAQAYRQLGVPSASENPLGASVSLLSVPSSSFLSPVESSTSKPQAQAHSVEESTSIPLEQEEELEMLDSSGEFA